MCFSAGNQRALETYYLTAVLMTLLPLVILGLIAGWLYFRFRDSGMEADGRTSELFVMVSRPLPRAPAE